jgi:cell division protein FtsQ
MVHGAVQGGHFRPGSGAFERFSGKFSGLIGQAAEDIEIAGLENHEPSAVLAAIGVRPGGSLLGFSPAEARARLEALDWVAQATVRKEFPNQLKISVEERQAYALWQLDGTLSVIDRTGVVLSGLRPDVLKNPLVVTGEEANLAAQQLVNQLEAVPELSARVRAASRLGKRRWNLYLDNGTKIMLPAENSDKVLREYLALAGSRELLSGIASELDLRTPGILRVAVAVSGPSTAETTASISER